MTHVMGVTRTILQYHSCCSRLLSRTNTLAHPVHFHRLYLLSRYSSVGRCTACAGATCCPTSFDACMNNEALFQGIRDAQVRYGKDLHVESTPTFIFNDDEERIVSNRGWEEFDAVMSELVE